MVIDQQRAPRKLSRQERRLAERQAVKGMRASGRPSGGAPSFGPAGLVLAGVLPTHKQGTWRLGSGWVSEDDTTAWHEAAHAVVALHLGGRVTRLGLEGFVESSGGGGCTYEVSGTGPVGPEELVDIAQSMIAVAMAGSEVASHICQDALRLAGRLSAEAVSDTDRRSLDLATENVPTARAEDEIQQGGWRAIAIVTGRRSQFGALVRALLVHRVMDEAQVLDVWNAAA